jgi:hypothetical protein
MPAYAKRHTPGLNGVARSCCRIHRCTHLPNGVAYVLVVPTHPLTNASRTLKARSRRSGLNQQKMRRCLHHFSIFRYRPNGYLR